MRQFTPQEINVFFPIEAVMVYPGGMVVQRRSNLPLFWSRKYLRVRGRIKVVSKRSLNKLALIIKSCGVSFGSIMVLTYGGNYPMSGKKAKEDLNKFLIYAKRSFGGFEYVWVLEFQERGAVHFHIATTLHPPDELTRLVFASIWQKISTPMEWEYCRLEEKPQDGQDGAFHRTDINCLRVHCFPRHWEAIRKKEGVGRYFAKYANKLRQKQVPSWYSDVGRFWGASRGVKLPEPELLPATDRQAREVAMEMGRTVANWEYLPKTILF